jgi:hypothetical protein
MAQYIDITELSRQTGLSITSIRRGVRTKRFPSVRAGGTPRSKLLFDSEAVKLVLEAEARASINKEVANTKTK